MVSRRKFCVALGCLVLAPTMIGCASMRRSAAERNYIRNAVSGYIHTSELSAIFPEARRMLFERGYQVRDSDGTSLETEYARSSENTEVRYLITATKSGQGWRVEFTKDEYNSSSDRATVSRDLDMEWDLIQRTDPAWANQIRQEARAHAATVS